MVDFRSPGPRKQLESLCEGIIEAGWLAVLVMAPLFLNVHSVRTFEPDKVAVIKSLTLLVLVAWLLKVLAGGRMWCPVPSSQEDGVSVPPPDGKHRFLLAPVLPLSACWGVSSFFSLHPRMSWGGSYTWGQGTWTELAYVAIAASIVAHLRTPEQWRRLSFVTVLTSLPVCLYALLQHLRLDPIPFPVDPHRIGSTLGNPIFLGAYLLMVFFVTLQEVIRSFGLISRPREEGPTRSSGLSRDKMLDTTRAAVLLYTLLMQLIALVLSGSRGPLLGLLAGSLVFALGVWAQSVRARSAATAALPSWAPRLFRGAAISGIVLAVAATLTIFFLGRSSRSLLRDLPYIGRLTTALDLKSPTAQVRLLIWQGASEILGADAPLTDGEGRTDPWHGLRVFLGYGPETFALAFNPHHPPALRQYDDPNAVPDRAHNETFNVLVTLGAFGCLAWTAVVAGLFHLALVSLGLMRKSRSAKLWLSLTAGAALGGVAAALIPGTGAWVGPGMAAGLLLGFLAFFVAVTTLTGQRQGVPPASFGARQGLTLALLATIVAHFVEIQLGILVAATRLYFWVWAAVLAAVALRWLRLSTRPPARETSAPASALTAGLLASLIGFSLVYAFATRWEGLDGIFAGTSGTLVTLLVGVCLAAALLAPVAEPKAHGVWRYALPVTFFAGLGPAALYAIGHLARLEHAARLRETGQSVVRTTEFVSGHIVIFTGTLVAVSVAAGIVLTLQRGGLSPRLRNLPGPALLLLAFSGSIPLLSYGPILGSVRADAFLKEARVLLEAGRGDLSFELVSRAVELHPEEPTNLLYRGRAALAAAGVTKNLRDRQRLLAKAAESLGQARRLAPWDPDHTANLARYLVVRGELARTSSRRQAFYRRAAETYDEALRLRPRSVRLLQEAAGIRLRLGDSQRAGHFLERADSLDRRGSDPTLP